MTEAKVKKAHRKYLKAKVKALKAEVEGLNLKVADLSGIIERQEKVANEQRDLLRRMRTGR